MPGGFCAAAIVIIALFGVYFVIAEVRDKATVRQHLEQPIKDGPATFGPPPPKFLVNDRDLRIASGNFRSPGEERDAPSAVVRIVQSVTFYAQRQAEWARESARWSAEKTGQDLNRLRQQADGIRSALVETMQPNRRPAGLILVIVAEAVLGLSC